MGCCTSATAKPPRLHATDPKRSAQKLHFPANPLSLKPLDDAHFGYSSDKRPPPPFEEETVKEVLSEKLSSQDEACAKKTQMASLRSQNIETKTRPGEKAEVFSEVSEITEAYSLSETRSISMATTISEKKDKEDDEAMSTARREFGRKVKTIEHRQRSKPKDFVVRREQKKNHPAKKPISSPRKNSRITERTANKKDIIAKREPENVSRRRSRSPAPRTTVDISKAKTTGQRGDQPPSNGDEPAGNESLENPLVSLECFIFL